MQNAPEMLVGNRQSSVLTRPTLACLADCGAINLTAGCFFRCRYCYAQGYSNNPGGGRIKFYQDSAERLAKELSRRRRRPRAVYFSTATDPFLPVPEILLAQFRVMELLLNERIPLIVSTKAGIPARFVDLFASHGALVQVQIGLTTVDDRVRALLEPRAGSVSERLENLSALAAKGVAVELRMDPLTPRLTDTDESVRALFCEAVNRGCTLAVASMLHIRKANRWPMSVKYGAWGFEAVFRDLYTETANLAGSGAEIRLPSAAYRRERYRAVGEIAEALGVRVRSCRCKNPDLPLGRCLDLAERSAEQGAFAF